MTFMRDAMFCAGTAALANAPVPITADDEDVELVRCGEGLGSIALVDSPAAG